METIENVETPRGTVEEAIRRDYADGLTYRELAKKYRKSPKTLVAILKGPRVEEEEMMSVELKRFFGNDKNIGGLLDSLLSLGNIKTAGEWEEDFRDGLFEMIAYLKKEGWRINRKDLARFLAGKLDFAVVRWFMG